ncbi:hypothetical protein L596_014346 [Steinernema carpocapsae]|uniref:Uncharacterized protein n=1 Tax=Steinernema carpocapsae TaxID=34508 RepID=A0A4U5NC84_STECR|nr:hypothetical protein L596_014346 [Steinernema carpocapsae]
MFKNGEFAGLIVKSEILKCSDVTDFFSFLLLRMPFFIKTQSKIPKQVLSPTHILFRTHSSSSRLICALKMLFISVKSL